MTIVFFGSSDFSISALKACVDSRNKVLLVITTPNRKKGRGLHEAPTPVREWAEKKGLRVETPGTLKNPDLLEKVKQLAPDLFVASAYGKLIPSAWLKVPSKLCLNVHPSLLPKYRGATPLQWPLLNGDRETGLSILEIVDKLDAGDIFYQERFPLDDAINAAELSDRLAERSYHALLEVFKQIENGRLKRTAQDESEMTYAHKLKKEDGTIDWNRPAKEIANKVRALLPWPTAYTSFKGNPLQILKAKATPAASGRAQPGEVLGIHHEEGTLRVQTAEGALEIETVRPAGKKEMSAAEFARGRRLESGSSLVAS